MFAIKENCLLNIKCQPFITIADEVGGEVAKHTVEEVNKTCGNKMKRRRRLMLKEKNRNVYEKTRKITV